MFAYSKVSPPTSPPMTPTPPMSPSSSFSSPMMTPLGSTTGQRQNKQLTATAKRQKYLRRIFKFRQMDFEFAFWQMLYLFISPQKVYRNFSYRKQTKDHWSRDDPAFLVLLCFWLLASSIGFSIVLHLGFGGFCKFFLWVVFIDCIGVGLCIATVLWFLTNKYLIVMPPRGQDVEWGYAFDVHLNAFYPLLMILHFFQLPFLNAFINQDWLISRLFGNTLWLFAVGYYIYITFLGYSSLPFLKKTQVLLYPLTVLFFFYIFSVAIGWNFSRGLCSFYTHRVM